MSENISLEFSSGLNTTKTLKPLTCSLRSITFAQSREQFVKEPIFHPPTMALFSHLPTMYFFNIYRYRYTNYIYTSIIQINATTLFSCIFTGFWFPWLFCVFFTKFSDGRKPADTILIPEGDGCGGANDHFGRLLWVCSI